MLIACGVWLEGLGFYFIVTKSLTNFQLDSASKRLLLIPALLWFIGVVLLIGILRSKG